MFSRKKPEPPKRINGDHDLSHFGLTDIPDDFDPTAGTGGTGGLGIDDNNLEAKLSATAAGSGGPLKPKPKLMPASDLDRMIADSLRDVGSDEELSEDDENDPDLLRELHEIEGGEELLLEDNITESADVNEDIAEKEEPPQLSLPTTTVDTIGIIKQRIEMYKQAESNAKAAGESGKARRFNRGLKTLNNLLKQVSTGKQINVDDIPPEVSVKPIVTTDSSDSVSQVEPADAPKVPSRAAPLLPPRPSPPPAEEAPVNSSPPPVDLSDMPPPPI